MSYALLAILFKFVGGTTTVKLLRCCKKQQNKNPLPQENTPTLVCPENWDDWSHLELEGR